MIQKSKVTLFLIILNGYFGLNDGDALCGALAAILAISLAWRLTRQKRDVEL